MDGYNASGSVNMGACAMARNQLEEAKSYFINALELDPACIEATYNLGTSYQHLDYRDPKLITCSRPRFEATRKIFGGTGVLSKVYRLVGFTTRSGLPNRLAFREVSRR